MVFPVRGCLDFTYYTRYHKFRSHRRERHVNYRMLFKCDLCVIVTKSNLNRNAHGETHKVQTCTFSPRKVQNESYISPGDCRLPKFPSDGMMLAFLESDSELLSHNRQSLRHKRQKYSQYQSFNHQQSEIVQNFELNML